VPGEERDQDRDGYDHRNSNCCGAAAISHAAFSPAGKHKTFQSAKGETRMLVSVVAALLLTAFAFYRSTRTGGFYDAQVYAMNAGTHRRYAYIGLLLAGLLTTAYAVRAQPVAFALDAVLTIVAVFYLTSFLRGAHEEL
jgi:hypothetical protein